MLASNITQLFGARGIASLAISVALLSVLCLHQELSLWVIPLFLLVGVPIQWTLSRGRISVYWGVMATGFVIAGISPFLSVLLLGPGVILAVIYWSLSILRKLITALGRLGGCKPKRPPSHQSMLASGAPLSSSVAINPATGLPMAGSKQNGSLDVGGNPFGVDISDNH